MKDFPVFGIGLGKTGTTTLNEVLTTLGWNSVHFPDPDTTRQILLKESDYNAATDTPIAVNYAKLYEQYPNAKFILTIRNSVDWLKSIETHQATKGKNGHKVAWIANLRETLYGSATFDADKYEEAFHKHHADIIDFFFEKEGGDNFNDKLLIIDLTNPEKTERHKWMKICKFLYELPPLLKFPHSNKGHYDKVDDVPRDRAQKETYSIQYKQRSVKEITS